MAIPHLSSGGVTSLLPLGDKLEQTPTTAFFKDERLEVMRIVLPAGKRMPAHAVDGPITVQCIEGEVDIGMDSTHTVIRAGDLLYLAGGVSHELTAIRNASLLVTVVLLRPSAQPGIASERRMLHDDDLKMP
jgi:quercetin dioxygenase-like cupin family protein